MLFRRIAAPAAAARPLTRALRPAITNTSRLQVRYASQAPQEPEFVLDPKIDPDLQDPFMNGGYINPPPVKHQHRDPYGDWWDKQERRNLGEPMHEDHDLYGMFSTWDYTHFTPGWGWVLFGTFVATFTGFCFTVKQLYPDKPFAPRTFGDDGLEKELGGPGALRARKIGEEKW
ncbi:hypothetical protein IWX49DRAFT_590011 [Phyllosticta citricarpa]|uniref:Uncharacterized protein n=2 Tax=Phyllosticta TaxID=121621 RepID=A0ABR1MPF4_9PEZI